MEEYKETDHISDAYEQARSLEVSLEGIEEADLGNLKKRLHALFLEIPSLVTSLRMDYGYPEDHTDLLELGELKDDLGDRTDRVFSEMIALELGLDSDYTPEEGDVLVVKEGANYEGNITNLMLTRLQNETIAEQAIKLIHLSRLYDLDQDISTEASVREEYWSKIEAVATSTPILTDEAIKEFADTGLVPKGKPPEANPRGREMIDILWQPATEQFLEYGPKQKGYIEAHEKGHVVRPIIENQAMILVFSMGIDLDTTNVSDHQRELIVENARLNRIAEGNTEPIKEDDVDKLVEEVLDYIRHPAETIERMAQLKNYFGMSGSEIFTRAHLVYARELLR